MNNVKKQVWKGVSDKVVDQVSDNIWNYIWNHVVDHVKIPVWNSIKIIKDIRCAVDDKV